MTCTRLAHRRSLEKRKATEISSDEEAPGLEVTEHPPEPRDVCALRLHLSS